MLRAACSAPSTFIAELKRSAKMKLSKKKLFEEACSALKAEALLVAQKNEEELRALIGSPVESDIQIGDQKLKVCQWIEDHPESGSLAIMIDARKHVAFMQQVVVFGVFRKKDGSIIEMKETDYYAHGY